MKAIYVSDDGKYFTDPEECRKYELLQNGYEVEIKEDSFIVLSNTYPNKQKCQHAVADYIHGICASLTAKNLDKYSYYKITVRHKGERNTFYLLDLIEEVPAHYKIDSNIFDKLIH